MRLQVRLLRLAAILATLLIVGSCEEELPVYERPEFEFTARIALEGEVEAPDTGAAIGQFEVHVYNTTSGEDATAQFVLSPPYEISADITVSMTDKPTRNILVSEKEKFDAIDDHVGPGEYVLIRLDIPPEDSQGHPWFWESMDQTEFFLKLGGTVTVKAPDHIPPVDIELHPPVTEIKLVYVTP